MPARSATVFTVETEPSAEDIRFLENGLNAFNAEATGIGGGAMFGVFARSEDGSPVGGAYGWTWGGICHVRYLFVAEPLRIRGLGAGLMQAVEREATARGCAQILLETYDFQAPGFYRKQGFEVVATIPDHAGGHDFLILRKRLGALSENG